jgi:NitT/TauT family transport system ATP-binding protein
MMSARPGKITREIAVSLPRPRSIDSLTTPAFAAYKAEIMAEMKIAHAR